MVLSALENSAFPKNDTSTYGIPYLRSISLATFISARPQTTTFSFALCAHVISSKDAFPVIWESTLKPAFLSIGSTR